MLLTPSYEARVTIVGVHIDNDGGGLGDGDSLEFSIRYITVADGSSTKITKTVRMFHVDLGDYTKFSLYDGQGVIHCFSILKPYVLREKHIKLQRHQNHKHRCSTIKGYATWE